MEGYHLSVAHAKTLHPVTPTRLCRKMDAPFGMTAYRSGYDPTWPERGPYHADLSAEERRSSVLFSVFPNLLVALIPNVTLYMIVNPHDVGTVDVKWGLAGTIADPKHLRYCRRRDLVIARDHRHADAATVALVDGVDRLLARRVHQANEAEQDERPRKVFRPKTARCEAGIR